jgi:ABC-type transport system involved in multi-copper enzyme maturation permease subunit
MSGGEVTLARVTRSEWTKLWSLRSTRWSLLVACIAMAGLGPLIAAVSMAHWNQLGEIQRLTFNPLERSLAGYRLAQLAVGVLGVMVISGEYSTGMIRSSLMAVPKRLPVLWAKLIVFSGVALVLMLVTSLISFFAAQAIFTQHHVNQTLSSPHALRVFVGTVLFMFVTGVLCTALGTIIRSTAGSISAYVALMFVLPGISDILPSSLSNTINPYLPSVAGTEPASTYAQAHTFSTWGGFALFCGYTVLAVVVAAYLLRRRDA